MSETGQKCTATQAEQAYMQMKGQFWVLLLAQKSKNWKNETGGRK